MDFFLHFQQQDILPNDTFRRFGQKNPRSDSNNSGIGIIGERNSTIIEVFVDNNTSNKITTGYPTSGRLINKEEIQEFYVKQVFGSLFDYRDKNVILNLNPNYSNLDNLDG
ncbi:MAG: hypothetical protein AABZ74_18765 [Cyanobacteriota bacterium]